MSQSFGKNRSLLVTGSSGVIGSKVVHFAREYFERVYAFDLLHPPQYVDWIDDPSVETVVGSVLDKDTVLRLVRRCSVIIHLAAPMSVLSYERDPRGSAMETITGFLNVIEAIRTSNVSLLVTASSGAVYEGNVPPYEETMILNPPDLKAVAKMSTEQIATTYNRRYKTPVIVMRPMSVYSPHEERKKALANVLSLFSWAVAGNERPVIWEDGSQVRDFVHADDAARAFLAAATASPHFGIYNIASGIGTSFTQALSLIMEAFKSKIIPTFVDPALKVYGKRMVGSPHKLKQFLGFRCTIPVADGIRQVVEAAQTAVERNPELVAAHRGYSKYIVT